MSLVRLPRADVLGIAEEGQYFTANNATPGTAINYAIQNAFSATVAILTIRNTDGANGKRIVPDYVRLVQGSTVPASATAGHYVLKVDTGGTRDSAGTVLTAKNPNVDVSPASIAAVNYTPTLAGEASARQIDRGVMRSVIPVANDEWLFVFGGREPSGISLGGAVAQRMVIPVPGVILGPNASQTMLLHVWFPGNAATAGQFEISAGWWEH